MWEIKTNLQYHILTITTIHMYKIHIYRRKVHLKPYYIIFPFKLPLSLFGIFMIILLRISSIFLFWKPNYELSFIFQKHPETIRSRIKRHQHYKTEPFGILEVICYSWMHAGISSYQIFSRSLLKILTICGLNLVTSLILNKILN